MGLKISEEGWGITIVFLSLKFFRELVKIIFLFYFLAVDFLNRLLERDPAKRISADEAMNHFWIKTHNKAVNKTSKFLKEPAQSLENLKKLKE